MPGLCQEILTSRKDNDNPLRGREGSLSRDVVLTQSGFPFSTGEGSSGRTGVPFTPCSRWVCPADSGSDGRSWGQHEQPAPGTPAWGSSFPPSPPIYPYTGVRFHRRNLHLL